MSLIEITDKSILKQIQNKIKNDCVEFIQFSTESKAKAADQLYIENRVLKELGVVAVDNVITHLYAAPLLVLQRICQTSVVSIH
jgi:hypothetical protein